MRIINDVYANHTDEYDVDVNDIYASRIAGHQAYSRALALGSYGLGHQMVLFISRQELESFPCGLVPMTPFLLSTYFQI